MGEAAKRANLFASCSGGGAVSACNDCATTRRHPHPTPPNRYAIRLRILPPSRGKGGGGLPCQHRSELLPREDMDVEVRSEEHTSELQSLMRISYAVFCLKQKKKRRTN